MRDLGNTLIVVEHDEDTMMQADWLIDVGPGQVSSVEKLLPLERRNKWLRIKIHHGSIFVW